MISQKHIPTRPFKIIGKDKEGHLVRVRYADGMKCDVWISQLISTTREELEIALKSAPLI